VWWRRDGYAGQVNVAAIVIECSTKRTRIAVARALPSGGWLGRAVWVKPEKLTDVSTRIINVWCVDSGARAQIQATAQNFIIAQKTGGPS
jgi:hypothetical protein